MFDPASANRGADNAYWYPKPEEPGKYRFEWAYTPTESLAAFNATPGEENVRYLSDVEKDQALLAVGIPLLPEARREAVVGKSASQIPKDYVPTQGIADRRSPELEAKGSETLWRSRIRVVNAVMAGGQQKERR
jgi:hypothetical protein